MVSLLIFPSPGESLGGIGLFRWEIALSFFVTAKHNNIIVDSMCSLGSITILFSHWNHLCRQMGNLVTLKPSMPFEFKFLPKSRKAYVACAVVGRSEVGKPTVFRKIFNGSNGFGARGGIIFRY